jgi:hypothetical protein
MGSLLSCDCERPATVGAAPASYSTTVPLADGDSGTAQTIALIRRAVSAGVTSPEVRETAARILSSAGVPAYDDLAEVRAVYQWVLENIRFTRDPVNFEMVSDAAWTLRHRIGDCDDINAVLLPALLMAIGNPVRLVTVANIPHDPESFAHVYAEVEVNGEWIPLDAARPGAVFGVAPARVYRKRIWNLLDDGYQDVKLSGAYLGEFEWGLVSDWISSAGNIITPIFQPDPVYTPPPINFQPQPYPAPPPSGGFGAGGIDTSTILIFGALGLGAVLLLKK